MSDEKSDGPRLLTAKKHDGSKGAAWEKWKIEYLDAATIAMCVGIVQK